VEESEAMVSTAKVIATFVTGGQRSAEEIYTGQWILMSDS